MEETEGGSLVSSTHEQQTLVLRDRRGELLDLGVLLEDSLDLGWQLVKACDDLVAALGKRDAIFGELEGNHQESDKLRCVRLEKAQ